MLEPARVVKRRLALKSGNANGLVKQVECLRFELVDWPYSTRMESGPWESL